MSLSGERGTFFQNKETLKKKVTCLISLNNNIFSEHRLKYKAKVYTELEILKHFCGSEISFSLTNVDQKAGCLAFPKTRNGDSYLSDSHLTGSHNERTGVLKAITWKPKELI
jgi:hypothetical protein